jgi:hypothetical protein
VGGGDRAAERPSTVPLPVCIAYMSSVNMPAGVRLNTTTWRYPAHWIPASYSRGPHPGEYTYRRSKPGNQQAGFA